jgi:hypothetical protein
MMLESSLTIVMSLKYRPLFTLNMNKYNPNVKGVVKTMYGLSAHFRVEIFPQILLLTLYVNALMPLACYQQARSAWSGVNVNVYVNV